MSFGASVDGIVASNPHFGNGADEPWFFAFSMTESTMSTVCFLAVVRCTNSAWPSAKAASAA
jgi:hypothetical protein